MLAVPAIGEDRGRLLPRRRRATADSAEMVTAAVGLRPQLLLKALELANGNLPDAEDLVQDAYLKFVAKPPAPRGPAQLRNWLRTVLRRRWIDLYRLRERDRLGDVASLDELL